MKLYYTTNSPFARKVRIAAAERGLALDLEVLNPWSGDNPVGRVNPAGKVPVLETADGMRLYDSPVICEYLDTLGDAPRLFPDGGARWEALRRNATGDALLDAMIARRLESRRPDGQRSDGWIERQILTMRRCLDAMEEEAASLEEAITIGHVAWACALGHIDFRFAEDRWRDGRPNLAAWFGAFADRPSFAATVTHD